jgi:hypothetical protein
MNKHIDKKVNTINANLPYIRYTNKIFLPSPENIKSMEERIKIITDLELNEAL